MAAGVAGAAGCAGRIPAADPPGDSGDPGDDPTEQPPAEPSEPYEPLGRVGLDAAFEAVVGPNAEFVHVAAGDGLAVVDVSDPADPALAARTGPLLADRDGGPLARAWDVAVDGNAVLVVGPAHGRGGGTVVRLDVSDPAEPTVTDAYDTGFPIHNCAFVDGTAYLTGNDGGRNPLVAVDVAAGRERARWSPVDRETAWADVHASLRPLHDVHVVDGTAYLAYWDAGTFLVDVSNPGAPAFQARLGGRDPASLAALSGTGIGRERIVPPGNAHYAAPNDDGTLVGVNRESWGVRVDDGDSGGGGDGDGGGGGISGGPGGIDLYDVSDPSNPVRTATIGPPATPDPTRGGVWTTSHNFELRGDRLYSAWYEGGVRLFDVSDPADPAELARWRDPATASFWTARSGGDGWFVASSTGHRPAEPAVYVFPDRPGDQPDPPPMSAAMEDAGNASDGHGDHDHDHATEGG